MPITGIFDRTLGRVVSMQEAWERAVAAALGGGSPSPPRSLTLDGAVKCIYGQLHPFDRVLDRFQSLEHLSIANIGVSSLEKFPRLRNLQRLILSDNRISGGLEFLVGAGLESLRDLDLSNNRIQSLEDLAPLARLRLVSLDLYECPVTRIADYRARVFALISSLKYLDKLDSDGNERPESDDDDDDDNDDDEDDEEEEEEDPGSGEVDGEEKVTNGVVANGVIDVDEDDESDADEEEIVRPTANGSLHVANGIRVAPVGEDEEDVDDEDFDEDDVDDEDGDDDGDQGEEIDEDDVEDEDVVEVHDISDSDDGDGVEAEEDLEEEEDDEVDGDDDDDEEVDGDDDEDEEDVEDEEGDGEPGSSVRMMSTDGEIDGHEQGEGEEDDNGEIGEEDEGVEEDEVDLEDEEEDDLGDDYHVQPHVVRAPADELEACNGEDEDGVEDNDGEAHHVHSNGPSTSSHPCNGEDEDVVEDDNEDFPQHVGDPSSSSLASKRKRDAVSDDDVEDLRSSKQR